MVIAAAAATALGNDNLLSVTAQVGHHRTGSFIPYDRADRHGDQQIVSIAAELVASLSFAARFRLEKTAITEIDKGIDVSVGNEDDVSALTAVAAVRSAFGHEFFVTETAHTVTALAGLYKNSGSINKHAVLLLQYAKETQHPYTMSPVWLSSLLYQ